MSEQVYDLGRSIRENSIIANEIIKRNSSYNFARVFTNSAYGIGLVGLGWVAIKLGRIIESAQEITDPTIIATAKFNLISLYVDGIYKDVDLNVIDPRGLSEEYRDLITSFRAFPEDWAEYKSQYEAEQSKRNPELKALDAIDWVYSRAGPVLPVSVLGLNALAEFIRMRKVVVDRVD